MIPWARTYPPLMLGLNGAQSVDSYWAHDRPVAVCVCTAPAPPDTSMDDVSLTAALTERRFEP